MGDSTINKPDLDNIEDYKDMDVGDILRRTRLHYGQSLKDIENALRIRESQLRAIENSEVEKLPGRVYAIGFVRTYAEYLGLDGAKIAQLFVSQHMDTQPKEELSFPLPASESKIPSFSIILLTMVFVVVFFFTIRVFFFQTESVESIPNIPESTLQAMKPSDTDIADSVFGIRLSQSQDYSLQGDENNSDRLLLKILSDSTLNIHDLDGNLVLSEDLKKGDEYFLLHNPKLTFSLSDARAFEIHLQGHTLMPLGTEGKAVESIPLDIHYLKTLDFYKPDTDSANQIETQQDNDVSDADVKDTAE